MANTHHIYAINEKGELKHVDEVERGGDCGCFCSVCKSLASAKTKPILLFL